MKKKVLTLFLCVAIAIGIPISVYAIYGHDFSGSLSAYLNAYGTSGYAGSEMSSVPYHVSASISCSWGSSSTSDTTSHDNLKDPKNPTSYTTAEVYVTTGGTISSAGSTHYAATSNGNWSITLPKE